jgi:hypothetical protein
VLQYHLGLVCRQSGHQHRLTCLEQSADSLQKDVNRFALPKDNFRVSTTPFPIQVKGQWAQLDRLLDLFDRPVVSYAQKKLVEGHRALSQLFGPVPHYILRNLQSIHSAPLIPNPSSHITRNFYLENFYLENFYLENFYLENFYLENFYLEN